MNALDRALDRLVRATMLGPAARRSRTRPDVLEPGERAELPRRAVITTYLMALLLPLACAVLLVPIRADHPQSAAIVLVVPVVLVAVRGSTGAAVCAALVAGLAYDVLLTSPYGELVIDDPDDLVAAITLVVVAVLVGVLSSRLVHVRSSDATRNAELHHLVQFLRATTDGDDPDELVHAATDRIAGALGLRACTWRAGYHGRAAAVLAPDGSITGDPADRHADQARLPREIELPATAGGVELGRFVLTAHVGQLASHEERVTATIIARVFAHELRRRHATDVEGVSP